MISGRVAYRRHLPHFQQDNRTYYVTCVTKFRFILPPLARGIVLRHIVFDDQRLMYLHVAVVMPDHAHLLLTPFWDEFGHSFNVARIMKGIKGASARSVNKLLGREGSLWQDESFDHELRNDESLEAKAHYVCMNPVRSGLVTTPDEYPWLWREWVDRIQT